MKKSILAVFALLFGSMVFASAQPKTPAARTPAEAESAQVDLMKLSRDARCKQVLVTALVNGQPMRMMLDTGATHTVLHGESAEKLKDARWIDMSGMKFSSNSQQIPKMLVASLQVGPGVSPQHPVIVVSLASVRSMMSEKIDGIVGMDILGSLPFTFDGPADDYYWGVPATKGEFVQIPGKSDPNGRLFMQVKSGEKTFPLLLDTGSSVTRVRTEDWAPGIAGEISAHIGDVDTAGEKKMIEGKPGRLEVLPGLSLKEISPLLCDSEERAMLGMDALAGAVLVHLPTENSPYGIFLLAR